MVDEAEETPAEEKAQDKEAQDVGLRYAGTPGDYKTAAEDIGAFASKLQAGSPVPEYQKAGEDKLKALFAFDQQLEGNYDPLATQRTQMYGAGVVPNPADIYNPSSQFVAQSAGGIQDIFSAIQQYKSLEGSALSNALGTIFNFLQTAENRKKRKEDRVFQILQITGGDWTDPDTGQVYHIPSPEEKAALEAKYRAGTKPTEKDQAREQAKVDASRGTTSEQLARAYGNVLQPWELLEIYNKANYYKTPIKDIEGQFYKWLPGYKETGLDQEAINAYAERINAGDINLNNVPADYRTEVSKRLGVEETPTEGGLWQRTKEVLGL